MLVSVVIPTYNPGRYLDPGIESLIAQTLDPREFEIIVVDDGSTDGTPEHLDELAAQHPNLIVVHTENSGWAGRPRNIGIERARGEFIQFMDQDDRMAPDALRRLTEMGQRNRSDIVLGKVASDFRGVALGLYRVNRDVCSIHDSQIISSLTPHKMFRRSFLDENGIRFPEGRRRLEDQLFVVKAYFAARVISIVADEICYFYLGRDDGGNAGSNPTWDPAGYYANLREVLDVVVANTERGPKRDFLMRRFFRAQLIGRLTGGRFLTWTPDFRAEVFAAIRGVLIDYVDPSVDSSLGAVMALRAALIRADRLDDLLALARRTSDLIAPSRIESVSWVAGALRVEFSTEFRYRDGTPFTFIRSDDRTALDPRLSRDLDPDPVDVTAEIGRVRLLTALRERTTGVEWATPTTVRLDWSDATPGTDGATEARLRFRGTCTVDPAFIAGGGRLAPGDWIWRVRLNAFGLNIESPLGAGMTDDDAVVAPPPQFLRPDLLVTPRLGVGVGVTIEVVTVAGPPRRGDVYRRPVWSSWNIRTRIGRGAVRVHGRLPPSLQRRTASLVRRVRSRRRSSRPRA
jgi:glycosyltransferase involved in cell wall biosynthesis